MRHPNRTAFLWVACGATAALLVTAGCSGGGAATDDTSAGTDAEPGYAAVADTSLPAGGELTVQTHIDASVATGLDPQLADLAAAWQLMSLVYETLVTIGPDFEIQPGLAESWDMPDETTYIFHLREGVQFSNGREMTADDVVGSLNRLLGLGAVWTGQLGPVKSVTAVDAQTVRVKLAQPYTPFLTSLANVPAAVLPMKEIDDGSMNPETEMLGTGPFVVADHRQDVSWRFERHDGYWNPDEPGADAVNVEIVPQESARIAALQDGSASMATLGNVDSPALLQGARNVDVLTQANTDFYYLMLNSQWPESPFTDPRVRQAVNLAIDRQQIADVALGGLAEPTGVTPAGVPGACDPAELPSASGDLDAARDLLAEAGAENLTFELTIFSTEPAPAVAQVIQQSLEEIGVTVEIDQLEETSWNGKVYGEVPGRFDAALSWFAGYADPGMVTKWWNPDTAVFNAGFMESTAELSGQIDTVNSEPQGAEREQAIADLCAAVEKDAQMLPLVNRPSMVGYRTDALSPSLYTDEGYGNPFRLLAEARTVQAE